MERPLTPPDVLSPADHAAAPALAVRGTIAALLELSKARLSALVVLTTAVGAALAGAAPDWPLLFLTILGTTLAAFGANALNQCLEVDRDARMLRTRTRPLPAGELTPATAWSFGLAAAVAGPAILLAGVNVLSAALCAVTVLLYVLVYTPMKVRTPLNTFVGAIVGGIPPMIGWAAATGELAPGAWLLGGILFVWQIPHFLALAWMYRDDYARGGYRMLPNVDASGVWTCAAVVGSAFALIPLTLTLTLAGVTGWVYAGGALLLGTVLLAWGVQLARSRTYVHARTVFLGSVIYLPLLLGLMVVDRGPQAARDGLAAGGRPAVAQVAAAALERR